MTKRLNGSKATDKSVRPHELLGGCADAQAVSLVQSGRFARAGVAQHLAGPRYLRALGARDVDQNAQVAQLGLEAIRFVIGKTEADQCVGVPAEGGRVA